MKSILEFLFSGELNFPGSWMKESQIGRQMDRMVDLEEQIREKLGEEQAALWKEYQEREQQMKVQQCRMEFERGFLSAANLALEIFHRTAEGEE